MLSLGSLESADEFLSESGVEKVVQQV
jgi:hypothetical protein